MLSLIIAESSIELVPKKIRSHPAVLASAKRFKKNPSDILLDNSWHFAAMKGIECEIKRGRPDLVHFDLLEATSIPLYFENKIKIYIHTINDKVIFVGNNIRLPKSFHRFAGLIEKLFHDKVIIVDNKKLLELKEMNFASLVEMIQPSKIIGLSIDGTLGTYDNIASQLNDACLVIGGFQKGHFSDLIKNKLDKLFRVEDKSLESHVILGRILYEYEKTIFM